MKLPPLVSSSLLAIGIDACSNIIAQRLKAWSTSAPFVFDRVLFFQFICMAAIGAPINFYWQNWLEKAFPGWKMVTLKRDGVAADISLEEKDKFMNLHAGGVGEWDEERQVEDQVRVRNWWNIFKKWFTDCITMGALINTTLFLVVMGILKGKASAQIGLDLRKEMFPIIWASYKVWPIANFFSTTYCPVERRIVFLSCCGLVWNIYLSLVAARL
ncbi:integral membrane protein-like protein [Amniculicola lignicola CBS 123094]|uniref:Integral membrane protein-like protein n=1 Tax=Amniculicola lignicola CBS 123094 TaxID=1392246 RepID=A0A6A5VZ26_9PLEO|nr:integral membrane protein-like protein [Amniculicola lignicola CBS 123094]